MNSDNTHMRPALGPWHTGEVALQSSLGVAARMAELGPRILRTEMPEQHRAFYAQLPFLVLGTVDPQGDAWAHIVSGRPGFAQSPTPDSLRVRAQLAAQDPLRQQLHEGAAIGMLGIELHTRRRNRLNGHVHMHEDGFEIAVDQAFGNCPQYIQARELVDASAQRASVAAEQVNGLDNAARAAIEAADTFFVTSYTNDDATGRRAVDVSHRGGRPGFVKVQGDRLTIPDFSGNRHFNTLGNLLVNPRAGLLFVDFETGDLLQVSGRTELLFDGPELSSFEGAERLWRVDVHALVRRPAALAMRFRFREPSPSNAKTGRWQRHDGGAHAVNVEETAR